MVSKGDIISYTPKNGGQFPDGKRSRRAEIEAIRGEEIIVRNLDDDFTNRITEEQIRK